MVPSQDGIVVFDVRGQLVKSLESTISRGQRVSSTYLTELLPLPPWRIFPKYSTSCPGRATS